MSVENLSLSEVNELLTAQPAAPTAQNEGAEPSKDGDRGPGTRDQPVKPEKTEPAAEQEQQEETHGDEPAAEGEEKHKPNRLQKRLDELTREKYEAQRERDYYKGLAEGRNNGDRGPGTGDRGQTEPDVVIPGLPPKPVFDDRYQGDFDAFVEDLAAWRFNKEMAVREMKASRTEQERAAAETVSAHQQRIEKARQAKPDFDAVLDATPLRIHNAIVPEIIASEFSAEIMYHLAKNPQEAEQLNSLPLAQQIKAIGRLEAMLTPRETPPPPPPIKRVSQAPEPITPIGGKQAGVKDESAMTDDEWLAHEREKCRKEGRLY